MITINNIIDGISKKLFETFGLDVYTENVDQGLNEPCFSIVLIKPKVKQVVDKRYFRSHSFCIYYFPKESIKEAYDIEERLFVDLEYIDVDGDLVRGKAMHGEYTDGILAFFVTYEVFTRDIEDKAKMEDLKQIPNVRKEDYGKED